MTTKYKIAKMMSASYYMTENPSYEHLLEVIYDNRYKTIDKVPINVFLEGLVSSFKLNSLEHANKLLSLVKEVVQEALEMSGIELTFEDEDWQNLKLVANTGWNKEKHPYELPRLSKSYMSEFFEN